MKKNLVAFASVLAAGALFAQEAGAGFDATSLISTAQTTITAIVTAFGTLLVAAAAFPLAKLGWRKFRAAISGV